MKIKLIKDYLNHTAGEEIEVTIQRAGYLVRIKVGKEILEVKKNKSESKKLNKK